MTGEIGAGLQIGTPAGGSATIGVVEVRKHPSCGGVTPMAGFIHVSVSVGYSADHGKLAISPADWTITDAAGQVSGVDPTITCERGSFKVHTLAQGGNDGGWIVFEVAKGAVGASLVYSSATGPVATWPLW